jgi:hypothetical protein
VPYSLVGDSVAGDQRVGMSEATSAPLGLAIAGRAGVLALYLASGPSSSQVVDWSGRGAAHIAAAGIADAPGRGSNGRASEKRDLEWLLVQSQPLVGVPEEDLILAEVPEFAPESVDEHIAREHGLQLVTRLTVGGPGRRIVVYRVFDGRTLAEVVGTLRRDRRVSSAQMNVVYKLPPAAPAQGAIREAKPPLGRQAKRQAWRYDRKGSGPTGGPLPTAGEPITALLSSGATQVLVTKKHGRLRWPAADEPFLDIGMTDK